MEWTREKDIELLAAFASGEQHNWFVFCRVNEVMIDETSSRMDYLGSEKISKICEKRPERCLSPSVLS